MANEKKIKLLNNIQSPDDLRRLNIEQLPELCNELREKIIEEVAVNPGHLASSLGAIEITVGCHYVFDVLFLVVRRDDDDAVRFHTMMIVC